nr:hypothetical protein [Tanacetum cinerariifolium]
MMVQALEKVGDIPTNAQDIPILIQPSSSQPQRKHKPRRKQRKETEVPQEEPPIEEHITAPSHDPLPSGKDRLQLNELMEICTKLSDMVLSLEQTKTNQATKIEKLKRRVKKLEGKNKKGTHGLKRLYMGRSIADIDQDDGTTLVDDTQGRMNEEDLFGVHDLSGDEVFVDGRMNEEDLFGVHDLSGDEVFVDVTTSKNIEQDATVAEKDAGEVVTTAKDVKVDAAATIQQISKDELTLAQTLMEIKAAKPKEKWVTIQEPNEFRTTSFYNHHNLHKLKIKAMMDAECELTAKLQEEERGELTIEEKSKLFVELMNKRKKHFKRLRAKERRRKPPTKAHKRKQMCTYLKNVNNFIAMDSEAVKDKVVESSKRAGEELEQESAKNQKLDKQVQAIVADDDTAELKRCLKIVPEDDDYVTIKVTLLSSKSPTIVDYKIYREGKKSYFKIIRAEGNS